MGLEEDLEYCRILLPAFADAMQQQVERWEAQIGEGIYTDFSSWRFI